MKQKKSGVKSNNSLKAEQCKLYGTVKLSLNRTWLKYLLCHAMLRCHWQWEVQDKHFLSTAAQLKCTVNIFKNVQTNVLISDMENIVLLIVTLHSYLLQRVGHISADKILFIYLNSLNVQRQCSLINISVNVPVFCHLGWFLTAVPGQV